MQRVADRVENKSMIRGGFLTFKSYKVFVPELNFIETYNLKLSTRNQSCKYAAYVE